MSSAVTPVVTTGNPRLEDRLAAVVTPDQLAALAGTAGVPGAANPYVTTSASRLGASGGLGGLVVVPGNGVVGDGTTDDAPALSILVNTTMAGTGTIYFTPGKTYRLATAITIPLGITLWLPRGALLKIDTAQQVISGTIDAGL